MLWLNFIFSVLYCAIKPGLKTGLLDCFMKNIVVIVTLPKMAVLVEIEREVAEKPDY